VSKILAGGDIYEYPDYKQNTDEFEDQTDDLPIEILNSLLDKHMDLL